MPSPHLNLQWMSQVLLLVPLAAPSSHCSPASLTPFPHDASGTYPLQSGVHDPGWPLLTPPWPRVLAAVPLSHCSPASCLPLPHFSVQSAWHLSVGVPLAAASSHCSPLVMTPSPQRGPSWQLAVQKP